MWVSKVRGSQPGIWGLQRGMKARHQSNKLVNIFSFHIHIILVLDYVKIILVFIMVPVILYIYICM